jgi:hypothetical protein
MGKSPYLISEPGGNAKLGEMWSWNLPTCTTCPGRTEWCKRFCYGDRGNFGMIKKNAIRTGTVEEQSAERNYKFSKSKDFVPYMIDDLREIAKHNENPVMRIHAIGDFYSPEYIAKWRTIIHNLPQWKFYVYTRTWQKNLKGGVDPAKMMHELQLLRKESNVAVNASTDPYTGPPPAGWKEAGAGGMWGNEKTICTVLGKDIGIQSKYDTCKQCGRCADPKVGGVILPVHSLNPDDIPLVADTEKHGIERGWKRAPIPWVLKAPNIPKSIWPKQVAEYTERAAKKAAKKVQPGINT